MLEQDKINEYTRLLKECEEAKQEAQKINTEISMLKKQGMEKLQEKGYKSLSEASKIDEEVKTIIDDCYKKAKDMILENYPDANIVMIDSRSNCMQAGFVVLSAAKAVDENKSLDEVLFIIKNVIIINTRTFLRSKFYGNKQPFTCC